MNSEKRKKTERKDQVSHPQKICKVAITGLEKVATSFIPTHSRPVTTKTRKAAQGSTTTSSHGISWRAKIHGRLSCPPKNMA
jgi:hypothetical protein